MLTIKLFLEKIKDQPDNMIVMVKAKEGAWKYLSSIEEHDFAMYYFEAE